MQISPLNLPTSDPGPRTFTELARSSAFEGLPGVLADSLPDRFGTALIQAHFERLGGVEVTPIQKLLYVGMRGPGALEYRPAAKKTPEVEQALEVRSWSSRPGASSKGIQATPSPRSSAWAQPWVALVPRRRSCGTGP